MAIVGGHIDCVIPVKVVRITRLPKGVTLEFQVGEQYAIETVREGDTIDLNYHLDVAPSR